jgi:flagellar operon protein (TIGR03826 family)
VQTKYILSLSQEASKKVEILTDIKGRFNFGGIRMPELENCPTCGEVYMKNPVRDVCESCYKEEEKKYDIVSKFLRVRSNRASTIENLVASTGVEEELIHKWTRKGRLKTAQFPNLGYPCDLCGTIITQGKLCSSCSGGILQDLNRLEKENASKETKKQGTYYSR